MLVSAELDVEQHVDSRREVSLDRRVSGQREVLWSMGMGWDRFPLPNLRDQGQLSDPSFA